MSNDILKAETFQHSRLEENSIRLLRIRPGVEYDELECKMHHFALDQVPPYVAISYRWGNTKRRMPILINSLPFQLMPNAYWSLYYQRRRDQRQYIWIDTLCIDQEATAERNHQVGLMGQIFSGATEVFAWLGHSNPDVVAALKVLNHTKPVGNRQICGTEISDTVHSHDVLHFEDHTDAFGETMRHWRLFECVLPLFLEDYWRRIWIIQEIHFSKRLTLMCGDETTPWESLQSFIDLFSRDTIDTYLTQVRNAHPTDKALETLDSTVMGLGYLRGKPGLHKSNSRTAEGYEPPPGLASLLAAYSMCECSDPRDKIFGLVGISNATTAIPFPVDYSKSVRDLLIATYSYITTHAPVHDYFETLKFLQLTLGIDTNEAAFIEWENSNYTAGPSVQGVEGLTAGSWRLDNGEIVPFSHRSSNPLNLIMSDSVNERLSAVTGHGLFQLRRANGRWITNLLLVMKGGRHVLREEFPGTLVQVVQEGEILSIESQVGVDVTFIRVEPVSVVSDKAFCDLISQEEAWELRLLAGPLNKMSCG